MFERFALILRQTVHAPIFAAVFFTHVRKCTRRRAESRRARVAFQEAMLRLADFPRLAFETDVPDVRVAPVLPYRYLIFYSMDEDSLVIRNVRHTARKWPPLGRPE